MSFGHDVALQEPPPAFRPFSRAAVFVEPQVKGATVKIWPQRKKQPRVVAFDSVVSERRRHRAAALSEAFGAGDALWARESSRASQTDRP